MVDPIKFKYFQAQSILYSRVYRFCRTEIYFSVTFRFSHGKPLNSAVVLTFTVGVSPTAQCVLGILGILTKEMIEFC